MEKETESGSHKVGIQVDSVLHEVRAGEYDVADLKKKVKVPAEKVLDQVIDGELKTLSDSDRVVVRGGEVFFSHVRHGGSS